MQKRDIRKGLPLPADSFDACYCSHVLEHLKRPEAENLIREIYRTLKPGAVVRLVVPDLENIVRAYLTCLEKALSNGKEAEENYDWMMLELYDQTVRYFSGGEMGVYLRRSGLGNKEFIRFRIGSEADQYWRQENRETGTVLQKIRSLTLSKILKRSRYVFIKKLLRVLGGKEAGQSFEEGWFRNAGEIHRWMYDRFSLRRILCQNDFVEIKICRADESRICDFQSDQLDVLEGKARKPDSLYMEASKPK